MPGAAASTTGTAGNPWLSVRGIRRLPVIRQSAVTECGLACVAMISGYYGAAVDLAMLRRRHPGSLRGASLAGIAAICRDLDFSTRAVRCSTRELHLLRTPCILHWRFNHFVILRAVSDSGVSIHDPARGGRQLSLQEIGDAFTGVALEVLPSGSFSSGKRPRALNLSDLLPGSGLLGPRIAAGILLALICEVLLLVSPLYLQTVIDGVIFNGDVALLNTLALVFTVLLAFQITASVMRALTFQFLGQVAVFDVAARVLSRLLRHPLRYFRSRELGDIQHRFAALGRVQSFIVNTAPALLLDGMFVLMLCALLVVYDPALTALNVGAVVLWIAWLAAVLPRRLRFASAVACAEASTQSHFLESIRGIVSVQAVNGEASCEAEWRNLFADTCNARIRAGNLRIADSGVRQVLLQGARLVTIYWLAVYTLNGTFTVGMLSAYASWLGMFYLRSSGLVSAILEFRMLQVPLERLADIVLSEPEPQGTVAVRGTLGGVDVCDVSFAYGKTDTPVLRNCSLTVAAGRFVALAGRSGSGKSTLLNILAGTEQPTSGTLRYQGREAAQFLPGALRSRIATVMQDDVLLSGSIAQNIALFDASPDRERMLRSADMACIRADIEAMPMGFETRVADLGAALSRGQVQRVLLARAFYRQCEVMLLDEVTGAQDAEVEAQIVANLSQIEATRIVVTHSDCVLAAADEVWWLERGVLLSSPPGLNA